MNPIWRSLGLALTSLVFTVLAIEGIGRTMNVDFEFRAAAFQRTPIFYRQPTIPIGEGFLRRPGPDRWTGKVLSAGLETMQGSKVDLGDPEVSITYDRDGFRNPDELRDWQVVITGDSFTELGYLPYEDLFTTIVAQRLGVRVKNLGVSYTGTLSQTAYLTRYGKAPSARHAVVVFFEGNDIEDIMHERAAYERAATSPTDQRSLVDALPRQSSILRAVYNLWQRRAAAAKLPPRVDSIDKLANAAFVFGDTRVPISVLFTPSSPDRIAPSLRSLVADAIAGWATAARRAGMKPLLAYMPCKRRVLDGYLTFTGNLPRFVDWKPTDLPQWIGALCARNDIQFVDLTPALVRAPDPESSLTILSSIRT